MGLSLMNHPCVSGICWGSSHGVRLELPRRIQAAYRDFEPPEPLTDSQIVALIGFHDYTIVMVMLVVYPRMVRYATILIYINHTCTLLLVLYSSIGIQIILLNTHRLVVNRY